MPSRFQRGSGCFKCDACGKLTRDTLGGNGDCHLCGDCYELAGLENELQDGTITQEEYDRRAARFQPRKVEG